MPAPSITWLGHSAFRLTLPDQRIVLVDPWLRENPACPDFLKQPPRCDLIVLTHGHPDHCDDVKELVLRFDPPVVANYDLCMALQKQIGQGRFEWMNTGGSHTVDGVTVTLTPAWHSSGVYGPEGCTYGGMPNGVVIGFGDLPRIYHAGDTEVFSDMRLIAQLHQPRICILPIGDRFTMGAKGAALAAEFLQPQVILPAHYRTFPLLAQSTDDFKNALSPALRPRLRVPQVGEEMPWASG